MSNYAIEQQFASSGAFELVLKPFSPRLVFDDQLAIFSRNSEGIAFVGTSTVLSAIDNTDRPEPGTFIIRTVTITPGIPFDIPRPLKVLAGSLDRVYRFLTPERHFIRSIVKLSPADYLTICEFTAYLDRTVFRYLFSALPLAVQADFVRLNIDNYPMSSEGIITNYRELATLLVDFIEERLSEPFQMMALLSYMGQKPMRSQMPPIHALRLGTDLPDASPSKRRAADIAIGEACSEVGKFFTDNRLLSGGRILKEGFDQSSLHLDSEKPTNTIDDRKVKKNLIRVVDYLLGEARRQLESNQKERKWNDQIF